MAVEENALVEGLQDSVGTGKARDIIDRARSEAGLETRRRFSEEEAKQLLDAVTELDDAGSFVQISANTMKTRIRTGEL